MPHVGEHAADPVHMTRSQTRTELAKGNVTPEVKEKLKVLAADKYECSQSAAIQEIIRSDYHRTYGDLDTQAIQENRIDDATLDAVKNGDLEPDELDDTVRSGGETARVPASDGGVEPHPESYHPTVGPEDLRDPGRELAWDELKAAVDERRWSEDVVINPARVPVADEDIPLESQKRLRASRTPSSKIIVAMARYEATGGMIREGELFDLITEYLGHITDRGAEGLRYVREAYRDHILEELGALYANPNPKSPLYYTTREAYLDTLDGYTENLAEDLAHPESHIDAAQARTVDDATHVLRYEKWQDVNDVGQTKRTARAWKETVGEWLSDLATLWNLYRNHSAMIGRHIDVDYPDEFQDGPDYLRGLAHGYVETVAAELGAETRDEILNHYADDAVAAVLRDPIAAKAGDD